MRHLRHTVVFATLLLLLCPAAQARTVLGLAPEPTRLSIDAKAQEELRNSLAAQLDDQVAVRTFASQELLKDWMVRFNEVDVALVSQAFYAAQPSGTFTRLAEVPRGPGGGEPLVLIARQGMSVTRLDQIKAAFHQLDKDPDLRRSLGLAAPARTVAAKPPVSAPRPQPAVEPAAPPQTKPVTPARPAAPPAAPPASDTRPAALAPQPAAAPPAGLAEPAATGTGPAATPPPTEPAVAKTPPAQPPAPAQPGPSTAAKRSKVRISLFLALLILIAIGLKGVLLVRHRQHKKKPLSAPAPAPAAESFGYRSHNSTPVALSRWDDGSTDEPFDLTEAERIADETEPAPAPAAIEPLELPPLDIPPQTVVVHPRPAVAKTDDWPQTSDAVIIESGKLTGGKVPALLKRCADLPAPVILEVKKGEYLKRVYFAAGQIANASPWCNPVCSTTQQWTKLGYLLVRDGLVSESAQEKAMELIERQPELHLGQALIKLGALELSGLRQALNRQTKLKVFALILFPEGQYRVVADDGSLSPEESVSLEVTALIREAAQHRAEWTAIRKALPSLDTRLDYLPDGRLKLEQVRLSVHQQLALTLIDGQRTLGEICAASAMMDYEVYRFLYLMVKSGVLHAA